MSRQRKSGFATIAVKEFEYPHRVIYAECTLGNHVYYGRYFEILEAARGGFFRAIGHDFTSLQAADFIFPVTALDARYLHPARYDDDLVVRIHLISLSPLRMEFHHRVSRSDGTRILEARTGHVCTSTKEKPRRMPKELIVALTPYLAAPAT